ncbi:MAG: hypothetical protein D6719_09945 [Candidatus Dadabacteria bacterium]|nr:MAG: hypothetical protein D6719_09945 [Candidatus Dadabacteria bacterium]
MRTASHSVSPDKSAGHIRTPGPSINPTWESDFFASIAGKYKLTLPDIPKQFFQKSSAAQYFQEMLKSNHRLKALSERVKSGNAFREEAAELLARMQFPKDPIFAELARQELLDIITRDDRATLIGKRAFPEEPEYAGLEAKRIFGRISNRELGQLYGRYEFPSDPEAQRLIEKLVAGKIDKYERALLMGIREFPDSAGLAHAAASQIIGTASAEDISWLTGARVLPKNSRAAEILTKTLMASSESQKIKREEQAILAGALEFPDDAKMAVIAARQISGEIGVNEQIALAVKREFRGKQTNSDLRAVTERLAFTEYTGAPLSRNQLHRLYMFRSQNI